MVMAVPRPVAYAFLLIQAVGAAPPLLQWYAPAYPELFPWKSALRVESEPDYMRRVSWDYRIAKMVEAHTQPSDRIFDLYGLQMVLVDREAVGSYQTSVGDNLFTGFQVALFPDRGLLYDQRASFAEQPLKAIRIRQTTLTSQIWSIHELELFRGERKVSNSRRWLLDAWPNSWEAPLALDQNVVSRWRTWEAARPGMFYEIQFDRPEILSGVNVVGRSSEREARIEIYGQRADDSWVQFPAPRTIRPALNLQRQAVRLVRRAGMKYILTPTGRDGGGPIGSSMVNHLADWGVEIAAHTDSMYLLRIP
jgi:hypothetical protein